MIDSALMAKTHIQRIMDYVNKTESLNGVNENDIINYIIKIKETSSDEKGKKNTKQRLGKGTEGKKFPKNLAIILFVGFGIPLDVLGIPAEETYSPYTPNFSNIEKILSLDYNAAKKGALNTYRNNYYDTLKVYLKKIKKRLWVYDYFGSVRAQIEHYSNAHDSYFEYIENELLKSKSVEYRRILALPLIHCSKDSTQTFKEALKFCSFQMFKHLVRCLRNDKISFKLFVVPFPYRLYNYAILDGLCNDGSFLQGYTMSEYYRYNQEDQKGIPDLLFINKISPASKIETLFLQYEVELKKIIGDVANGKDFQVLRQCLSDVIKETEIQLKNLQKKQNNFSGTGYEADALRKKREEAKLDLQSLKVKHKFLKIDDMENRLII